MGIGDMVGKARKQMDGLVDKAKHVVEERGGVDALKEDLSELKDVATSKGSLRDKAKAAAKVIKDPGAPGGEQPRGDAPDGEASGATGSNDAT